MSWYFGVKRFPCKKNLPFVNICWWCDGEWNRKDNARLVWFGFAVWSTASPFAPCCVSITNFVTSKISCSVFQTSISFRFVVPTFESFFGFFFPGLLAILWASPRTWCKNYVTSFTKIDWSVLFLFMFQIWYLPKWITTSIGQNLHMRVTHLKSLWVSGLKQWDGQFEANLHIYSSNWSGKAETVMSSNFVKAFTESFNFYNIRGGWLRWLVVLKMR